jgi:light-harvesting complex 1 beta chain
MSRLEKPWLPTLRGLCATEAGLNHRLGSCEGVVHMAERRGSISGLTDEEAQEFHQFWTQGFVGFTAIAVVAHILVWIWRPWF